MRLLLLLLIVAWAGSGRAAQPLHLFIWSEYIDPAVVADFEKQFEAKVTIDLYEDEAAMMAKLQAGGASLYDVVVPPDHKVTALIRLKLLAPLRHEHLPNLANLDEKFRNPPYDRGNQFSVAYQWGTLGLYTRAPGSTPAVPTWGAVFDPAQQAGPFVLIASVLYFAFAASKPSVAEVLIALAILFTMPVSAQLLMSAVLKHRADARPPLPPPEK